jgi:hypothetical protein
VRWRAANAEGDRAVAGWCAESVVDEIFDCGGCKRVCGRQACMEYDCEWVSGAGRRSRCFGYAGCLKNETVGMATWGGGRPVTENMMCSQTI